MKNKIKVLQSVNSLGIGGNVIFVMNFFRHIDKEKFQVDFVIYDGTKMNFYDEVTKAGSKVYIIKKKYKNKYLNLLSQMHQVRKLLKNHHYDIIHCHSCSFVGIFRGAIPGFFTKNTKVISHAHNPGMPKDTPIDNLLRNILKYFLSHIVDMGFSCSDYAGESKYTKKFMNSLSYQLIYNAVEVDKYQFNIKKRNKIRKYLNMDSNMIIGNVGRLSNQKNQTFLIDIFFEIKKVYLKAKLLIIGGGELEEILKDKVQKLKLEEDVYFTGSITNVEDYYSAMDVFVMPSLYEGLPFTAIEAQMNGLKCILSDNITKMADASGDTVFLSLKESIQKWSESIIKCSESRSTYEKTKNVLKNYNLVNEAKRLELLYKVCKKG